MGILDGLVGGIGGLFGGGYKRQANPYTGNIKGIAGQYGQWGQQQQNEYNNNHAQYLAATQSWADLLNNDRNNNTYRASQLAGIAGDTARNYQQGKAKFLAEMQRNGMAQSGMTAGGLSSLAGAQAGALSSAQNQYYLRDQEDRERRKKELVSLYGNRSDQASSGYLGALGAQTNLNQYLYGNFEQDQDRRQQEAQQRTNSLLGLLSTAGGIYGSVLGSRKRPSDNAGNTYYV